MTISFTDDAKKQYAKSYGIVGNHSGVQICHWTRNSLRGGPGCYKVKFYGIDCHRCAQISPALAWCNQACIFCWRPMEWMKKKTVFDQNEVDEPEKIIEGCVRQRDKLISGFGGASKVCRERFTESYGKFPSHWAISLSGEPTIYPKLGELVLVLKKRKEVRTIFIVTNGQEPGQIKKLADEGALPTQLYLSLSAANETMFKEINRSVYKDGWERLLETIGLFPGLPCRRAIRLTLIRGINDGENQVGGFAALIERSKADFVEVKAYMALGFSRKRLGVKNMPEHMEVRAFAEKLASQLLEYTIVNEDEASRIVLMKRKDSRFSTIIENK